MKVISILALSLLLLPGGLTPASLESVVDPSPFGKLVVAIVYPRPVLSDF